MKEIKIRGLDESTVLKLKELSAKSGYPSLNKYLVRINRQRRWSQTFGERDKRETIKIGREV